MTLYNFAIGTTTGNLSNLELLGLAPPFQDSYTKYGVEVEAADNLTYGHGQARTGWRWGIISQDDRDILKAYCPGKSAVVYTRLLGPDNTWNYCQCVLVWPTSEIPANNGYIFDLALELKILQNYGASLP